MNNYLCKYQENKVSVIIPTYKRPNNIYRVVNNVLQQDYGNLEILIIDDNGKGTVFQKETYKSLTVLLKKHNNIKYICLEKNSGACKARNKGIEEARGEYIAFLDDDDYWHPNFITSMVSTLKSSGTQIGYSNFYRINEKGIFYNITEKNYRGNIRNELVNGWCPATTSLFCIKRKLLLESGGFDQNLKNLEEYDLWLRLSEANYFSFCENRLVLKSESKHEQLTNNYHSRILAWNKIRELWKIRDMNGDEKKTFLNMVDENIISDRYHLDLQIISKKEKPKKYNYGAKRNIILKLSRIFGISLISNIRDFIITYFGPIKYLSASKRIEIENQFHTQVYNKKN